MSGEFLEASMSYFGVSPWEAEVIYEMFSERFRVRQVELSECDPGFVSVVNLSIPLEFNEEFFKWFEYKRWDKVKSILKEMKRRRGNNKGLKIEIGFLGIPRIGFVLDVEERSWFDSALEKMDFVIELLPFQLSSVNIPHEISKVVYNFDTETRKWKLHTLFANEKKFNMVNNVWKPVI
jgi:hypothetical protein